MERRKFARTAFIWTATGHDIKDWERNIKRATSRLALTPLIWTATGREAMISREQISSDQYHLLSARVHPVNRF
jgi:hypothetical protein